jgi:hypothetical protein
MSLLGGIVGGILDAKAKSKAKSKQADLIQQSNKVSQEQFDRRNQITSDSDARTHDLIDREYADTSGLEDSTFGYLLGQNQAGFDEQQTIAKKAFDEQMSAFGGLMTAKRASRLEQIDASERELARQRAFQAEADQLADALPGKIGFAAQEADRSAAFQRRGDFAKSVISAAAAPPSYAKDPRLAAAYAGGQEQGVQAGIGDALSSAKLSSYRDAFQGAERNIADFGSDIDVLGRKAANSRAALPAELAPGDLKASDAQQTYDWTVDMSKDDAQRRADLNKDYRTNLSNAQQQNADSLSKAFANFFGRSYDTENTLVGRLTGASSGLENKIVSLNNMRVNNTQPNYKWGDLARLIDKTGEQAARAMAGGG